MIEIEKLTGREIELIILTLMSSVGVEKVELPKSIFKMHEKFNNHVQASNLQNGNLLYEIKASKEFKEAIKEYQSVKVGD